MSAGSGRTAERLEDLRCRSARSRDPVVEQAPGGAQQVEQPDEALPAFERPTCSNMPILDMAWQGPSSTSRRGASGASAEGASCSGGARSPKIG